jgi:ectoine hydroxylase-related dioxygenase (phytanoyl-CoA dioxygenase family)
VYQGIVYVLPSQPSAAFPNSSTTVLLPKSHTVLYDELMAATSPHSRSHYCEINHVADDCARARLGEAFRQGCRRAPMPGGSLLLWNSRTLHQVTLSPMRPPANARRSA